MKKRLIELIEYLKISVRKFEVDCSLQRGNIGNMSDDSAIGSDKLSKIIDKFPFVNIEWLLTGKGTMLKNNQVIGDVENSNIVGANVNGNGINIHGTSVELINIVKKQQDQIGELINIINRLSENG